MNYAVHTPRQLGQVLRGQRKTQQLTQSEVGASVGLLPKTISKLELDTEATTIESLFKLLSALQLELILRPRSQESVTQDW